MGVKDQFVDESERWAAVRARDSRADGQFWCCVKTTGIYCRPSCPARPKRENVSFATSSQDARSRGYRACKRCRPDEAGG